MGESFRPHPTEAERSPETPVLEFRTYKSRIDKHGNWQDETERASRYSEDTLIDDPTTGAFGALDGVGGQSGGKEASREAAAEFVRMSRDWGAISAEDIRARLPAAVAELHRTVLAKGKLESGLPGGAGMDKMATTACLVRLARDAHGRRRALIANVGDSRAYLLRRVAGGPSTMTALTHDRNEFLGYDQERPPTPEVVDVEILAGDRLVLTTDGILKNYSAEEIRYVIDQAERKGQDPARALVDPANMIEVRRKFAAKGIHRTEIGFDPSQEAGVLNGDDFSALVIECLPASPPTVPDAVSVTTSLGRIYSEFLRDAEVAPKIRTEMEKIGEGDKTVLVKAEFDALRDVSDTRLKKVYELSRRYPEKAYGILYALGLDMQRGQKREDVVLLRDVIAPVLKKIKKILS